MKHCPLNSHRVSYGRWRSKDVAISLLEITGEMPNISHSSLPLLGIHSWQTHTGWARNTLTCTSGTAQFIPLQVTRGLWELCLLVKRESLNFKELLFLAAKSSGNPLGFSDSKHKLAQDSRGLAANQSLVRFPRIHRKKNPIDLHFSVHWQRSKVCPHSI